MFKKLTPDFSDWKLFRLFVELGIRQSYGTTQLASFLELACWLPSQKKLKITQIFVTSSLSKDIVNVFCSIKWPVNLLAHLSAASTCRAVPHEGFELQLAQISRQNVVTILLLSSYQANIHE
jgi:hypothetical protein